MGRKGANFNKILKASTINNLEVQQREIKSEQNNLDEAYSELKSVITSEKMKMSKANTTSISNHVDQLLEELSDRLKD